MKNVIIGVLALAIVVLGYFLFFDNKNTAVNNQPSSTAESSSTTSGAETLDLSGNGLTVIRTDTFNNSRITVLNVSNNNLTGALPAEIRKLSNLEVLNASNNKMTGVPAEIGQLTELRTINYANNNLSGLPLEIGNLSSLETLDLRGNPNISKYDISLIQPKIPNAKILTD